MGYIPTGTTLVNDIDFSGIGWADLHDSDASYGDLEMGNGYLKVIDNTTHQHVAFRTSQTITSIGFYIIIVNCKSNTSNQILTFSLGGDNKTIQINSIYNDYSVVLDAQDILNYNDRLYLMLEEGNNNRVDFNYLTLYNAYYLDDVSNFSISFIENIFKYRLLWNKYDNNNIMLAFNIDSSFGIPSGGYSLNDHIIGGGVVVYIGDLSSIDKDIIINEYNYYKIWSYKYVYNNYYYSDGIQLYKVGTVDNFISTIINSNTLKLNWSLNTNNDNVLISWSIDNMIFRPTDGVSYNIGYSPDSYTKIVYTGTSTEFIHNNLLSSDNNLYYIWSYNNLYEYSPFFYLNKKIISNTINNKSVPYELLINKLNWTKVDNNNVMIAWSNEKITHIPNGEYNVGDMVGNSVVLYIGDNIECYHNHGNGVTCWYKIWSYKDINSTRVYSDGVDMFVVGNNINFNLIKRNGNKIICNWDTNNDNNLVILAYSLNDIDNLVDGNQYEVGDILPNGGEIIYKGTLLQYEHNNLLPGIYNYKLWSTNRDKYSYFKYETISLTLGDVGDPLYFSGYTYNNINKLNWSLYNNLYVIIAVNTVDLFGTPDNDYNIGDNIQGGGTIIYKGNNVQYDHFISNGQTVFYKIWSYNDDLIYSNGLILKIIGKPIDFYIDTYNYGGCDINVFWLLNQSINDVILIYNNGDIGNLINGIEYNNGDNILDGGNVLYVGKGTNIPSTNWMKYGDINSFSISLPLQLSVFKFRLYSVDNNKYSSYIEISGNTIYDINEPTFLNYEYLVNKLKITWSLNSNNDNIILTINENNKFGIPVGKYNVGDNIQGGGIVLYIGNNVDYIMDIDLNKTYYYKMWSVVNSNNIYYYSNSGVNINVIGMVDDDFSVINCNSNKLKWSLNFNKDTIMISTSMNNNIGEPINGNEYNIGDNISGGTILYIGDSNEYIHSNLFDNMNYYYKIWSFDNYYNYSKSKNCILLTDKKVHNPNNFKLQLSGSSIHLSWDLNSSNNNIRLSYSLYNNFDVYDDCGSDKTNGILLIDDTNQTSYDHHIDFNEPFTIFYKIWSKDQINGNIKYSNGVFKYIYIDNYYINNNLINDVWNNNIDWVKNK